MAKDIPYKPVFPYTGKQIIIDSDRVTLNSKDDMTFLIAKKAVSISSGGTVNIDSEGMTIINSPKIKLGLNAEHPLVYGDTLVELLTTFFGFMIYYVLGPTFSLLSFILCFFIYSLIKYYLID